MVNKYDGPVMFAAGTVLAALIIFRSKPPRERHGFPVERVEQNSGPDSN